MKELSIEEKARRYDKAIERAKGLIDFCSDSELKTLEYVFSELKKREESKEDEEIRNEMIEHFKEVIDNIIGEEIIPRESTVLIRKIRKYIAWLEKQGEKELVICPICGWEIEKQGKQKPDSLETTARLLLDELSKSPYNNKPITDAQTIIKELLNFLKDSTSYNPNALNDY